MSNFLEVKRQTGWPLTNETYRWPMDDITYVEPEAKFGPMLRTLLELSLRVTASAWTKHALVCPNAWHTFETWSGSQRFQHPAWGTNFRQTLTPTSWEIPTQWSTCCPLELLLLISCCSFQSPAPSPPSNRPIFSEPTDSGFSVSVLLPDR